MLSLVATLIGVSIGSQHAHAGPQFCRVSEGLQMVRLRNWAQGYSSELESFQLLQTRLKTWVDGGYHLYSNPEHESMLDQLQIRALLKKTGVLLDFGGVGVVDFAKAESLYARATKKSSINAQVLTREDFLQGIKWVLLARSTDRKKIMIRNHFLSEEVHAQIERAIKGKLNRGLYPEAVVSVRNPIVMEAELEFSVVSKVLAKDYLAQLKVLRGLVAYFPYQQVPASQFRKWAHDAMTALKAEFTEQLRLLRAAKPSEVAWIDMAMYLEVTQAEYQVEQLIP